MSRAISSATTNTYFQEHYSAAAEQYYSEGKTLEGQWHGRTAAAFGLEGSVQGEGFERLMNGQNPATGEQLIRHRNTHLTEAGKELEHRAAWDAVFQPAKSVSLTGLVGGDPGVVEAHRSAVRKALDVGQEYVQARGGGEKAPITTRAWAVAIFDHNTARPERTNEAEEKSLYAAPHIHSHCVIANMTTDNGKARSLQPQEIFKINKLLRTVYQSELKHHLRELGYTVHEGKNGAAEIQGYTPEYLAAESLRSIRIKEKLEALGLTGRRAEEIIAHQGRGAKLKLTPEEVRALHLARAAEFGDQPKAVVLAARNAKVKSPEFQVSAHEAVSAAKRSVSERLSLFDHFEVLAKALEYGRGYVRVDVVEANIAARSKSIDGKQPEFITVEHGRPNTPGLQYTTREAISAEREVLQLTQVSRQTVLAISPEVTGESLRLSHQHLNEGKGINAAQATAAAGILQSRDRVTGLQGAAGTGKTSATLRIVTEHARAAGLQVVGLAPTGRARKELAASGIDSQTLQRFLTREEKAGATPRLFIVDESSLVSTRQYLQFLKRLGPNDRVLEVGDVSQHESVEAGRIFHEQQLAGMETHHLTKIVRQQNPEMVAVVELLQEGKAAKAIQSLSAQGRVAVTEKRRERLERMATDYARAPAGTLAIAPDNETRQALADLIRGKLQAAGHVGKDAVNAQILVPRQDLTAEDRKIAASYDIGTVVQYQRPIPKHSIEAKSYATVISRDSETNTITVQTADKRVVTYDPRKAHGVELFETDSRALAEGDTIIFRQGWKEKAIVTGDRATVAELDSKGNIRAAMEDSRRSVVFNVREFRHIDYGYVTTSYSAQGATADRVIVHMDTSQKGAKALLTKAMAYVSLSRPRQEFRVFTDDAARLEQLLETSEVKKMALHPKQVEAYRVA